MSSPQSVDSTDTSGVYSMDHPTIIRKMSNCNNSSCSSLGVIDVVHIHHHDLPLFIRRDLHVGALLGRGRFSQVRALDKVPPGLEDSDEDQEQSIPQPQTQQQQQQQQQQFVIKHLQQKLFQHRTHRRVAKDLTNALADLVSEAMYLSKLQHPHIVTLRGLTRGGTAVLKRKNAKEDDYFLILGRMQETLDQRIRAWKGGGIFDSSHPGSNNQSSVYVEPTLKVKAQYALQIADALRYLHSQCILYRDLKPENIGFTIHGVLQLFDFGLARELPEPAPSISDGEDERVYTLSPNGTRRYMAVEIFTQGKYNYKADVYSWAMVFYEMLAMVKPFADFTVQSHKELVCCLGGRPRMDDVDWSASDDEDENNDGTLPEDVEALLHQGWHQDPRQRLSMSEVYERLQNALDKHFILERYRDSVADIADMTATATTSTNDDPWQQDLLKATPVTLREKQSTSEMTESTDPLASSDDSDQDDIYYHDKEKSGRKKRQRQKLQQSLPQAV